MARPELPFEKIKHEIAKLRTNQEDGDTVRRRSHYLDSLYGEYVRIVVLYDACVNPMTREQFEEAKKILEDEGHL